ncbi:MAG: protein kinase [Candidatus Aminicenantaceae bacterium]
MGIECPKCRFDNPENTTYCGKCGARLAAQSDIPASDTKTLQTSGEELFPGYTFADRYQIIEELGTGGMGRVYRVLDTKLNEEVALKLLKSEIASDKKTLDRFSNELKIARKIVHKNVGRMFDLNEERGTSFIAMEYVPGEDLKSFIRRAAPLSATRSISIAKQICEGLSEAHRLGVIHRDLKPSNIMIDKEGNARIMDFGIARSLKAKGMTGEGVIIGTPEYMSPEQVEGKDVDQRSDIYSLGVILYEMVTGNVPFEGETPFSLAMKHKTEPPPDPRDINTQVPEELSAVVLRCMEKDREKRYQSTGELLTELSRIEKGFSRTDAILSKRELKAEIPRKRLQYFIVPGILLLAAILITAGYFIFERVFQKGKLESAALSASARKMIVVLPFENLGPPMDEYFAEGMTEEITSRLANIKALGVIARESAAQYADTDKTVQQIGEELGVDYVLGGTVRWARSQEGLGRVRITPKLIQTSDNTYLWAGDYEHVIDDIFEIQSEIAQSVVEKLGVTLLEPERRAIEVPPTENIDAYQAYLRGRWHAGRPHFTLENWNLVIQSYQQAVELDPSFALAYAELSKAHSRLYFFQHDLSEKRREMARKAANRAFELASESSKIHLVLSYYYLWAFRDSQQALRELEIAEKGMPHNAEVMQAKAYIYELQGRFEEARDAFKNAFEISPRNASLPTELMFVYWYTRRYPQAIEAANQAIALAPDEVWPYLGKAFVYWSWKGKTEEARSALEAISKSHSWLPWAWFWQEMIDGRYREAIKRLSLTSGEWIRLKMFARPKSMLSAFAYELLNEPRLARRDYESAQLSLEAEIKKWPEDPRLHSSLGIVYAHLGRKENAIQMGKRAVELFPVSRDAVYGIPYAIDLAFIYTTLGEYEEALTQIEYLLSKPSWVSVSWLRHDPRWIPLLDHPEFKPLLGKYSKNSQKQ